MSLDRFDDELGHNDPTSCLGWLAILGLILFAALLAAVVMMG